MIFQKYVYETYIHSVWLINIFFLIENIFLIIKLKLCGKSFSYVGNDVNLFILNERYACILY